MKHTAILSPSASCDRSRAAFTRFRAFAESNLCSKSGIAVSHGSPTSVSRMSVANGGGMHNSKSRPFNGFSIFYSPFRCKTVPEKVGIPCVI